MFKKILFSAILILASTLLFSQKNFTISGVVKDAASEESMISAAVVDIKSKSGVVTNNYGFYSLTLPQGKTTLLVTFVGYKPQKIDFNLRRDTVIDFSLGEGSELQTVEVSAKKQDRIENQVQTSRINVPIEQIKKIPALLGEVDVLKVLQLLPGVQAGGEGQNGLYVRGGSPDQNLVLLDGVPVYNVSHVGGLFSVFNGDAIKNVTLTKGGFPARFGGRLSSIIEIDMKEGNMKEFHGEGGIGIVASRLTLEGPIVKNKASFMVSARRTYLDVLAAPFIKNAANQTDNRGGAASTSTNDINLALYFYDLNAKVNWKINDKHRLYLSAYNGRDILGFDVATTQNTAVVNTNTIKSGLNWGNITSALRWNYVINKKLFANTTATYTNFNFNLYTGVEQIRDTAKTSIIGNYLSGINDWSGRIDFDYLPNPNHRIRFGLGSIYHTYNPGALQVEASLANLKLDTVQGNALKFSTESSIYVEDEMKIGRLLKANVGLHATLFNVEGKTYQSIQPRINLNYPLSNSVALKASFASMQQYINLLTNENIGLPTDLWVPSTAKIKPQDSWQAVIGAAKTVKDEYEVSIEGYYKAMNNVISYKEGTSFLGSQNNWEDKITQGKGTAYGAEIFVQKKEGRLTGWVGYTLSWNKRQFEDINSGIEYPFKYDRRHDFKVVGSYKFTDNFSFTSTWVYGTGNAITLYTEAFALPTVSTTRGFEFNSTQYAVSAVGDRNAYRMPNYHRLDVNFEWKKQKKRFLRTWSVGAYNAYNRANPYSLTQSTTTVGNRTNVPIYRQVSLIPIIPSVTYGFKF
jgi:CarboxypepD_reg-like domain/TonB-dependent Receptor Plug Domain